MYTNILVPLDGTPLDQWAMEQATAYAASTGARLTFMHARLDTGTSGEGALLHAMSPADFSAMEAGHSQSILAKAQAGARAASVPSEAVLVVSQYPHEAILETAKSLGCDLIYMASHGRRGLQGALVGSVTRKVLQNTSLPVLIATVESNQAALSDEHKAIGILRSEHRSLAAVLHALQRVVDNESLSQDPALVRALVFYIEQFPERLHHPKEEDFLFRKLRLRTQECDVVLSELEQQHKHGSRSFAHLRECLANEDRAAFRRGVHEFADLQWQHMRTEERLVLPAASRYLQAQDWQEIASAFASSGGPSLDASDSFEQLADQLLGMAQGRSQ